MENQVAQQQAVARVGVGTHATLADGSEIGQFRCQFSLSIEEFIGPVAEHPLYQHPEVTIQHPELTRNLKILLVQ